MMLKNGDFPTCLELDCFANVECKCKCLKDNDFYGRKCPFYKHYKKQEKELKIYPVIKYIDQGGGENRC